MWIIYAFGSATFAGLTSILAKCGIKDMDSNLATALRTIIVLIFSWIMVFVTGGQKSLEMLNGKTMVFLILSGLSTGASWLCYFRALQKGDINKVTPVDKLSTILTMILAFIFFRENITLIKAAAMIVIGAGTYMMIQKKETDVNVKTDGSWFIYAAASAIFASLTSILGKAGMQGIDSNLGTAIRTVVVLIMAWVVVFVTGKPKAAISHIDKKSGIFLVLSGIATGASWLCYYRALQTGPASVVVPVDKLSILVTIAFSYVVFKEKLSRKSAAGLALIVAGTMALVIHPK